jgi:hypothetical protein
MQMHEFKAVNESFQNTDRFPTMNFHQLPGIFIPSPVVINLIRP